MLEQHRLERAPRSLYFQFEQRGLLFIVAARVSAVRRATRQQYRACSFLVCAVLCGFVLVWLVGVSELLCAVRE